MGLDSVELVIDIEEKFQIRISDDEAESIQTAGDLFHIVRLKLAASGRDYDPGGTWDRVVRIIHDNIGAPLDKIRPESRLVEDLGMD